MPSTQLPLDTIAFLIFGIVGTTIILQKLFVIRTSLKEILLMVAAGIVLTAISLQYSTEPFGSGTGMRVDSGWPHFFHIAWESFEGIGSFSNFVWGSLGSYVVINILFYATLIWFLYNIAKLVRRKVK